MAPLSNKSFFNKINITVFLQSKKYFLYFRHFYIIDIFIFRSFYISTFCFSRFLFSTFFSFEVPIFDIFFFRHFYLSIFFCEIFRHFYHSTFFLSIKLGLTEKFVVEDNEPMTNKLANMNRLNVLVNDEI
jgi:hypothetical protein